MADSQKTDAKKDSQSTDAQKTSALFQALKDPQTWGVILSVAGILTAGISLVIQFFNIDNGSSGQLTVESNMRSTFWPILLSFLLLFVGGMLYLFFDTTQKPYLWLFGMSFGSLFLANFSLMMSLYQVQITKV